MCYRISNLGAKMMLAWPFGNYIALKRPGYIAKEILEEKEYLLYSLIINRGTECISANTESPVHV